MLFVGAARISTFGGNAMTCPCSSYLNK